MTTINQNFWDDMLAITPDKKKTSEKKVKLTRVEQKAKNDALAAAVQAQEDDLILQALEDGASPNTIIDSRYGDPLLHHAIRTQKFSLAELAIEYGADINRLSSAKMNGMNQAVLSQNIDFVQLLLKNGASLNSSRGEYHTDRNILLALQGTDTWFLEWIKLTGIQDGADLKPYFGRDNQVDQLTQSMINTAIKHRSRAILDLAVQWSSTYPWTSSSSNNLTNPKTQSLTPDYLLKRLWMPMMRYGTSERLKSCIHMGLTPSKFTYETQETLSYYQMDYRKRETAPLFSISMAWISINSGNRDIIRLLMKHDMAREQCIADIHNNPDVIIEMVRRLPVNLLQELLKAGLPLFDLRDSSNNSLVHRLSQNSDITKSHLELIATQKRLDLMDEPDSANNIPSKHRAFQSTSLGAAYEKLVIKSDIREGKANQEIHIKRTATRRRM